MQVRKILPSLVVMGLALAVTARYGRGDAPTETSAATESPVLKTEQFENGELRLPDVQSERLEAFLRDLNHRRDYDFSQHDHQPGPDNEYLTHWTHQVMDELFTRGYYVDPHGELHRPGPVVPTR